MKKFVITAILAAAPFFTFAQSAFDKFNDVDGIETISIDGALFDMVGEMAKGEGKEAEKLKDKLKNVESFKMYSTSEKKYKKELRKTAEDYLKSSSMEQLLSINNDGTKVKIYVKQDAGTNIIREGLVFIDDEKEELMVIAFKGAVDLSDAAEQK
jgi:hypothetical protein